MDIKFGFKGQFLGTPEPKQYDNGKSYSISIMVDGQVGQVKCDEAVYSRAFDGEFPFGSSCLFNATYNTDYRSARINKMKLDTKAQ